MATKYQRIMKALHRAFQRGDIDEKTFEELADQVERDADQDYHLLREEYQRDHARDYRKHER